MIFDGKRAGTAVVAAAKQSYRFMFRMISSSRTCLLVASFQPPAFLVEQSMALPSHAIHRAVFRHKALNIQLLALTSDGPLPSGLRHVRLRQVPSPQGEMKVAHSGEGARCVNGNGAFFSRQKGDVVIAVIGW
jgi:hypothetical protein